MAFINFDGTSSHTAHVVSPGLLGLPLCFVVSFKHDTDTALASRAPLSIADNASNVKHITLIHALSSAPYNIFVNIEDEDSDENLASIETNYSPAEDKWITVGVRVSSTHIRTFYKKQDTAGVLASADDAHGFTWPSFSSQRLGIGHWARTSPAHFLKGMIGEIAIWDQVLLTDEEMTLLVAGMCPLNGSPIIPEPTLYYRGLDDTDTQGNGPNVTYVGSVTADATLVPYYTEPIEAGGGGGEPTVVALPAPYEISIARGETSVIRTISFMDSEGDLVPNILANQIGCLRAINGQLPTSVLVEQAVTPGTYDAPSTNDAISILHRGNGFYEVSFPDAMFDGTRREIEYIFSSGEFLTQRLRIHVTSQVLRPTLPDHVGTVAADADIGTRLNRMFSDSYFESLTENDEGTDYQKTKKRDGTPDIRRVVSAPTDVTLQVGQPEVDS